MKKNIICTMITQIDILGKTLFAAFITFILPIYSSIFLILLLLFIDFIFKLLTIRVTNEPFIKDKSFTFLSKSIVYTLLLILLQSINPYLMTLPLLSSLGSDFTIKIFTLIVFSKELKSIDEKVKILVGFSLLKWLINLINLTIKKIIKE
jgi:hypothetical protein